MFGLRLNSRCRPAYLIPLASFLSNSQRWVPSLPPQPSIEMPAGQKQEMKSRLASVLWDAVEECVQRLNAEGIDEKSPVKESPAGEKHQFGCCSEIRHVPVGPTPKEDSITKDWMTILQPIQKDDKAQCKAWNEEIQNILIFAALFSAVVTAFLIDSIHLLSDQPGSQGSTISATRLSSSIRINVFWLLSLVLSLATALIGIIAAQWLREHASYPEHLTSEQVFALLNMKICMLKKWRVRGIISSLSVLLQISLLLFFAGLVQFLFSLGVNIVTIPVTALIGISGLYPIVTTVLPALHIYVWQKETIVGGDVPVPCPYKSPQAELFYAFSIVLSNHRPFPQLFSLVYALVTFIPTTLLTIAILVHFYLRTLFANRDNLGRKALVLLVVQPISLFFKALNTLSKAADSMLHYHHEVRMSIQGLSPIHYDRAMEIFRPAMKDEAEYWWAFDVAWVSIRRDYAFRLCASRSWNGEINADRRYIMREWKRGENDPPMVWGKAISRESAARAGPPWDQIQGLILLRRQYQHNDPDSSIMEAALRCFKSSVSSFRAYDKPDNALRDVRRWMIGFENATTEILRPYVRDEVTFANCAHSIDGSSPTEPGVKLCTASIYHEALFHFIGSFHLEKLTDKGEVRLKTAWVEVYYKLVCCQPSDEDLQKIQVPFAFATRAKDVSSVTFRFSQEEEQDLEAIYSKKARACARHFDRYRRKGATADESLKNQVLHDFFFAIGAAPFYARRDAEVPSEVRKLISSLSEFCQYLKRRDNPDMINLVGRIETGLGDTVDKYFEDFRMTFPQHVQDIGRQEHRIHFQHTRPQEHRIHVQDTRPQEHRIHVQGTRPQEHQIHVQDIRPQEHHIHIQDTRPQEHHIHVQDTRPQEHQIYVQDIDRDQIRHDIVHEQEVRAFRTYTKPG